MELVEAVDTGGGLLGDATPFLDHVVPAGRVLLVDLFEEVLDDLLLVVGGGRVHPTITFFEFVTLVEKECHIAAVVDDHLGSLAAIEGDGLVGAPPVFLEAFTLPGKDGNARDGDRGGRLILCRKDIATGPADIGAEIRQGLDENSRLNGHVE